MMIRGRVVVDRKTKDLVKRIKPREIAFIDHLDLDLIAGQSLVEKQVKAVFNLSSSISGKYPNLGPSVLLEAGIPLIDVAQGDKFYLLHDGEEIIYKTGVIYLNGQVIGSGIELKLDEVNVRLQESRANFEVELDKFIDNTLNYARQEKKMILDLPIPDVGIDFTDRQALIVVRGADYKEDLEAIESYIREVNPIIVAVDGGADACLERGYHPDLIMGDMDSVSDRALKEGDKIIVHAYPDGRAPGLNRIKNLGLDYILFPAPGTSEDIAMLLAYELGAELITAVGTHSNMIDFLEKGRSGMASTMLVRLKVGRILVDAKGVSRLYQGQIHYHYWFIILIAILLPLSILVFFSPPIKQLFQLLALRVRLIFDF